MSDCVMLYDVRVVDGFMLRLDVRKSINASFDELQGLRELIKSFDFDTDDIYVYCQYKKLFFTKLRLLRGNLFLLHEIKLLSGSVYKRLLLKLDCFEKEIG